MTHRHDFFCCRRCRLAATRDVILAMPKPCRVSWTYRRAHLRGRAARIDHDLYPPTNPYLGKKGRKREARFWWGGWYVADEAVRQAQQGARFWSAGPPDVDHLNNPHRYLTSGEHQSTCFLEFEETAR